MPKVPELKTCTFCKEPQDASCFVRNCRKKDGLHNECKTCMNTRTRKWYREGGRQKAIAYNNERHKRQRRECEPRGVVCLKLSSSKGTAQKHGWIPCTATLDELTLLFTSKCEICGTECGSKINLDHCHKTGKFRGFLCHSCNTMLGHCSDSEDVLLKMIAYIRRTK